MQRDSIDKIITYFEAVNTAAFEYKGKLYEPKPLHVSPQFFNEFVCVLGCAGCCPRFSLDYLPTEISPRSARSRVVILNGKEYRVRSHLQGETPLRKHCDYVDLPTGACTVHEMRPFSCDFETLRFVHFHDHTWLGTKPFGRGWAMLRVDGERGAKCGFTKKPTEEAREDALRKLQRLAWWADHFEIPTCIPEIMAWASTLQTKTRIFNKGVPEGYTAEALERDNPHNAWLQEGRSEL